MEIKDILSYKQIKAFKDYVESCGVEYTGKKSQIQLISLWIDSIQIKQPQQSMSNSVKKKFTELEDKVSHLNSVIKGLQRHFDFEIKEDTPCEGAFTISRRPEPIKPKWYMKR